MRLSVVVSPFDLEDDHRRSLLEDEKRSSVVLSECGSSPPTDTARRGDQRLSRDPYLRPSRLLRTCIVEYGGIAKPCRTAFSGASNSPYDASELGSVELEYIHREDRMISLLSLLSLLSLPREGMDREVLDRRIESRKSS